MVAGHHRAACFGGDEADSHQGIHERLTYIPVRGTLKEMAQAFADSLLKKHEEEEVPDFVEGMIYTTRHHLA